MMLELRGAGGSGGNSTSAGAGTVPRDDSQSIAFRLTKNETATTATPSGIVFRRIVPPDWLRGQVYRAGSAGAIPPGQVHRYSFVMSENQKMAPDQRHFSFNFVLR